MTQRTGSPATAKPCSMRSQKPMWPPGGQRARPTCLPCRLARRCCGAEQRSQVSQALLSRANSVLVPVSLQPHARLTAPAAPSERLPTGSGTVAAARLANARQCASHLKLFSVAQAKPLLSQYLSVVQRGQPLPAVLSVSAPTPVGPLDGFKDRPLPQRLALHSRLLSRGPWWSSDFVPGSHTEAAQ